MTEIGRQSVRKEGEIIPEQSTYSFADFLRKAVNVFARKGIVRTDGQRLRIHEPVFSLKARNQNPFRANRL